MIDQNVHRFFSYLQKHEFIYSDIKAVRQSYPPRRRGEF